jgi:dihydrofolate reductase
MPGSLPQVSVYIATSLDGYIATVDDRIDWLEEFSDPTEDYGYAAFLSDVDALAQGRGTYDVVAALDPLPFGGRPLFVFTHRMPAARPGVTFWSRSPEAAVSEWSDMGLRHVYVDGGRLVSDFLDAGLVDTITITTLPVLLGDGLPLFHAIARRTPLRMADQKRWPSGVVQHRWER